MVGGLWSVVGGWSVGGGLYNAVLKISLQNPSFCVVIQKLAKSYGKFWPNHAFIVWKLITT